MHKRERSKANQDILPEQVKRLKEEIGEKVQGQFYEGQVAQRSVWKREEGNRKQVQVGKGCQAFSRLLREEAAGARRRLEIQRKLRKIICNISLISLGFGLGWILNWKNRSMAICQCL